MECTSYGYKLLGREFAKQGLFWQTFLQLLIVSTFSFCCPLLLYSSLLREFVDFEAYSNLSVGPYNS